MKKNLFSLFLATVLLILIPNLTGAVSIQSKFESSKFISQLNGYLYSESFDKLYADSSEYATIYFYRPAKVAGKLTSFDVHLDGGFVAKMKNNSKFEVKVFKEGPVAVWVGTEYWGCYFCNAFNNNLLKTIDVKFGKSYYLEFSYKIKGIAGVVTPVADWVTNEIGSKSYYKISRTDSIKYFPQLESVCHKINEMQLSGKAIPAYEQVPNFFLLLDNSTLTLPLPSKFLKTKNGFLFEDPLVLKDDFSSYTLSKNSSDATWFLIKYSSSMCYK